MYLNKNNINNTNMTIKKVTKKGFINACNMSKFTFFMLTNLTNFHA
jgi:hypothetical protein